ncbi:MAG: esterase-like activity of phytase family protein [Thiohalocapsa sp.]|nr:esterase-like activity of phytase family protein [Thiohalocapsa sp.]
MYPGVSIQTHRGSVENDLTAVPASVDPRRVTNRGMEGLTLTPDGSKLVGMMQNALQQDGGTSGSEVRILVWDTVDPGAAPDEYVYELNTGAGTGMVVSEIVAVNDREFLIIERDKNEGTAAQAKRIIKIDLDGATNVAGIADLDDAGTYTSVAQSLFMDLIVGVDGSSTGITDFANLQTLLTGAATFDLFPEKLEGIAFGPELDDGRHLLLIGNDNDNDFRSDQPNYVLAFAVDPTDLAYTPRSSPMPRPSLPPRLRPRCCWCRR